MNETNPKDQELNIEIKIQKSQTTQGLTLSELQQQIAKVSKQKEKISSQLKLEIKIQNHFFLMAFLPILFYIILAISVIYQLHKNGTKNFKVSVIIIIIYQILQLSVIIKDQLIYGKSLIEVYQRTNLIITFLYMALSIGVFGYLQELIPFSYLQYIAGVNFIIIFIIVILVLIKNESFFYITACTYLIDITQIYIIIFMMNIRTVEQINWTLVLLMYKILGILFYIFLPIFLFFDILLAFFPEDDDYDLTKEDILLGICFTYFICYFLIFPFLLLLVFQQIISKGMLSPQGSDQNISIPYLVILYLYVFCSTLALVVVIIWHIWMRKDLQKQIEGSRSRREMRKYYFTRHLGLNVDKQSDVFFKTNKEKNKQQKTKNQKQENENQDQKNIEPIQCSICCERESNVLFSPCQHSGCCDQCIQQLMKQKKVCPYCKKIIDKAFIIYFDSNEQKYKTKGFIDF